jgi:hypothetical protein
MNERVILFRVVANIRTYGNRSRTRHNHSGDPTKINQPHHEKIPVGPERYKGAKWDAHHLWLPLLEQVSKLSDARSETVVEYDGIPSQVSFYLKCFK